MFKNSSTSSLISFLLITFCSLTVYLLFCNKLYFPSHTFLTAVTAGRTTISEIISTFLAEVLQNIHPSSEQCLKIPCTHKSALNTRFKGPFMHTEPCSGSAALTRCVHTKQTQYFSDAFIPPQLIFYFPTSFHFYRLQFPYFP